MGNDPANLVDPTGMYAGSGQGAGGVNTSNSDAAPVIMEQRREQERLMESKSGLVYTYLKTKDNQLVATAMADNITAQGLGEISKFGDLSNFIVKNFRTGETGIWAQRTDVSYSWWATSLGKNKNGENVYASSNSLTVDVDAHWLSISNCYRNRDAEAGFGAKDILGLIGTTTLIPGMANDFVQNTKLGQRLTLGGNYMLSNFAARKLAVQELKTALELGENFPIKYYYQLES